MMRISRQTLTGHITVVDWWFLNVWGSWRSGKITRIHLVDSETLLEVNVVAGNKDDRASGKLAIAVHMMPLLMKCTQAWMPVLCD